MRSNNQTKLGRDKREVNHVSRVSRNERTHAIPEQQQSIKPKNKRFRYEMYERGQTIGGERNVCGGLN